MLTILSIISTGCGTTTSIIDDYSDFPEGKTRPPHKVWSRKDKPHSQPQSTPKQSTKEDKHVPHDATTEQWKRLDIKLDRHDNKKLYNEIKSWLGTPYEGGSHKKQVGTDCSGFVMEIYLNVYDMKIERNSARIYTKNCIPIRYNELSEGDLIFFHNGDGESISHVGIYLKDNKFAHASSSRGVVVDDLSFRYYTEHFYAAGRVKRQ
jgi:lipoprotein Spr